MQQTSFITNAQFCMVFTATSLSTTPARESIHHYMEAFAAIRSRRTCCACDAPAIWPVSQESLPTRGPSHSVRSRAHDNPGSQNYRRRPFLARSGLHTDDASTWRGKSAGHIRNLSPHQLQVLEDTLRDWFGQLRALEPPDPDAVCGFGGNGIKSYRIRHDEYVGPFASQKEFHEELVSGYEATHSVMAAASHSRPHRICFTHGDITPHSILLNEDMRPVGLIDWECAGWLPEYWEYTYALYIRYPRYKEWSDLFTRIFPQYRVELEVEYELWEIAAPW